jgi:HD superfamily phosphodiesterase
MTDTIKSYIDALSSTNTDKPEITDNGKQILKYLQEVNTPALKARDIASKIEEELDYPGQIKINMIRETRVFDYAK